MSVASDLITLGWRDGSRQSVKDYQAAYNLGPALVADGNAGPATLAAIKNSIARHKAGLPDISEHFSAYEFACNCGKRKDGAYSDCRRIWTPRETIQLVERYRELVGPFAPVRAGRCPRENRNVGGVPNSYHLTGRGVDVPVFDISVAQAQRIGANGVGYYEYTVDGKTVRYVRHIDTRPTGVIPWPYPKATRPKAVLRRRPDLASKPIEPQEKDDMNDEQDARLKRIETALNAHDKEEDGRYAVDTGRYAHLVGLLKGGVDETAIANALAPALTAAVNEAAKAAGITDAAGLAEAVVERFGAQLSKES